MPLLWCLVSEGILKIKTFSDCWTNHWHLPSFSMAPGIIVELMQWKLIFENNNESNMDMNIVAAVWTVHPIMAVSQSVSLSRSVYSSAAQPVVYCCDIPQSRLQAALATTVTMVTLLCCFNEYAALLHRGLLALSPIVWWWWSRHKLD